VFKKASKAESKLRLAIYGPAGSGKTFSSLSIASGIGGKIAVIDSERGSAKKYADLFDFDVAEIDDKSIAGYAAALSEAKKAGYQIVIIDSLSHCWQELLAQVEKIAQARFRGNSWSAWSEGTPMQNSLIDKIIGYPGHVIATMRSKTEWVIEQNEKGKSSPRRIGLAPEQGKGIEYEFDMILEMTAEHTANVIKSRIGKYQDQILEKPGVDFGTSLKDWVSSDFVKENFKQKEPIFTVYTPEQTEHPKGELVEILNAEVKESDFDFNYQKIDHLADLKDAIKKCRTITDLTILFNQNNMGKLWKAGEIFESQEEKNEIKEHFTAARKAIK